LLNQFLGTRFGGNHSKIGGRCFAPVLGKTLRAVRQKKLCEAVLEQVYMGVAICVVKEFALLDCFGLYGSWLL